MARKSASKLYNRNKKKYKTKKNIKITNNKVKVSKLSNKNNLKSSKLSNKIIKNIKFKNYFLNEPGVDYSKLRITNIGLYSVSRPRHLNVLSTLINKYIPNYNNLTITDATAGLGSDTILFTKLFKFVNAIEIDNLHYKLIKHNLDVYHRTNYKLYNDDATKLLKSGNIKQDVIYFDPPWGGPDYKKYNKLELYLGDTAFSSIIEKYIKNNIIICKLPYNYDFNKLHQIAKTYNKTYHHHKIDNVVIIFLV